MKKLLALLLALAMMIGVVAVLASCGEEPPAPPAPGPEEQEKDYSGVTENNLIIKLNLVDGMFTNMLKRYMSGEDDRFAANVDDMIAARNTAAIEATGITPFYDYIAADDPTAGWGANEKVILADMLAFEADVTPDVYVTAAYDSIGAAINGGMANLLSTSRDNGLNYFSFVEEGYNAAEDDKGYNYDLMRSFSPVPDKAMFMLASDYTIDVFRGLHIIPVSITLLEGMDVSRATGDFNVPNFDYNENGTFEIDELLDFVWEGKWTYDVMATLCAAIYVPAEGASGESFGDSIFGFYFDRSGGSSGNAITYATPFDHWSKTYDDNGVPTYTQYDNTAFQPMAAAWKNLMETTGAMRLTNGDVTAYTTLKTAAEAIGEKFGRNEVLFSENVLVGYIESSYYQEMEGSFGLVPQPLIVAGDSNTKYTTALGNAARVLSIGVRTDDFAAATAFVDYQSTHSSDIMKQYYRSQQYEATNGEDYNVRMLTYLRTIMVSQEAQFMNLYTWRMGLTDEILVADDEAAGRTAPEGGYLDFKAGTMVTNITQTWREYDDAVTGLGVKYTEKFMNTMTACYRYVVEKFVAMAETN